MSSNIMVKETLASTKIKGFEQESRPKKTVF